MPLVQIHLLKGVWTPTQIKQIADSIQDVMLSHFNAPIRDRYQIITQHEPYELICEDTNLPNLPRSDKLIFLHIFQQGRDAETKQKTYAEMMKTLKEKFGLGDGDLIISVARNEKEDWSFGAGRAQFLTGEL
ncbi:Tautomerase/MIF [Setomelanomma holmii]|uniref:Tautomerase/MIF n=1 Tax=Setomelanomma holmii TaxID=210430 RepID=A0A9P4LVA4_9PLEO|nr:Tautomerase/MIF [Setomelanomma holmii]